MCTFPSCLRLFNTTYTPCLFFSYRLIVRSFDNASFYNLLRYVYIQFFSLSVTYRRVSEASFPFFLFAVATRFTRLYIIHFNNRDRNNNIFISSAPDDIVESHSPRARNANTRDGYKLMRFRVGSSAAAIFRPFARDGLSNTSRDPVVRHPVLVTT